MILLYRYFWGYLKVCFYGEFPEKVLNFCADKGISFWGAKSVDKGITVFISIKDFYSLPAAIKGSKIRVHIEKKYGFPFIFSRYKKRWGLFVGVIIFVAFLEVMSSFIWIIDINGNDKVKNEEIIVALREMGIYEGVQKDKISAKNDSQRLLLKMDKLAWASLNIEGSRLTVNVTETQKKEDKNNRPCNLKAEFDGVIKKIDLKSGNSVVKVGDTVKKGDVLVSGIIENAGGTRFVCSEGEVIAEITRTLEVKCPYTVNKTIETGEKKNRRVLEIFTLKIPLFLGDETRECNSSSDKKQLRLFGVNLPIRIYEKEYRYTKNAEITKTEDIIKSELQSEMEKKLKRETKTDYKIKSTQFTDNGEEISLKTTVVYTKNIVYKDFLLISTGN